jgi:hypothetical protein
MALPPNYFFYNHKDNKFVSQLYVQVPGGTSTTPSISFIPSPTSGFSCDTAGRIGIIANGNQNLVIDTSSVSLGVPLSFPLGTAANPSITFTGDPNTGIYSPGADQVAVSTGGTGRLFIDSSGRVQIGPGFTGDANTLLELFGTGDIALRVTKNGFGAATLRRIDSGIVLDSAAGNPAIRNILFTTSDGTTLTERVRIDSDGKVGIGTSSPAYRLHVNGDRALISANNKATSTTYLTLGTTDVNNPMQLAFENITNSCWTITSVEQGVSTRNLSLNPGGGNVGIGTSSPQFLLHIVGAGNAGAVRTEDTSNSVIFYLNPALSGGLPAIQTGSNHPIAFAVNSTERARIDTSGRLLVGTSTARTNFDNTTNSAQFQLEGTTDTGATAVVIRNSADANAPSLKFAKSRGAAVGSNTVVIANDAVGALSFQGSDGTEFVEAGRIETVVDATPGANDMPGRLVLSVTLDGAAAPTEALRITNDRVVCYNQATPATYAAAATLSVADLKTGIITYTGAAATLTLPTGTLTEGGFSGVYTNMTFEWSVINTGSGTCTIGVGTGHTITGAATIAAGSSGRFASRRTASNTFVSYRIV